jgi:CelD/BcsL family acetyltransferase involved in cellulose biosynthesis
MGAAGRMMVAEDQAGASPVGREAEPSAAGLSVRVHRAAEAIEALAPEWTRLAAEAAEPNVFAEHWFIAASLRNMAAESDVRLVEVRRGGRLIGILPLTVERGYAHLPVRFVQNWYHDHMFLGTPLVAAGEEKAFWAAALQAVGNADWAPGFLHLRGISEGGPVHRGLGPGAIVHRRLRAFLRSDLGPAAYFEQAVRPKKRKELRRLKNRLAEIGPVETRALSDEAELKAWCDAFLALERKGWKGKQGTALACAAATERFFREALAAAWGAGRLQFLRLDLAGRPIAMLVNFLSPPGGFSFKTVFDEEFARFSPGVLLQIENLAILDRPGIDWMDSCAVDDHQMIEALWRERRSVVRVTVPLRGARRSAIFALCRALERGSAKLRGQKP